MRPFKKTTLLDDLFRTVEELALSEDLTSTARRGQDARGLAQKSEEVVSLLIIAQRLKDSSKGALHGRATSAVQVISHRIHHLLILRD